MASIERTAYPRFIFDPGPIELERSFTPNEIEIQYARSKTNSLPGFMVFLVHLKCFQHLGYFPMKKEIPSVVIEHIRLKLGLSEKIKFKVPADTLVKFNNHIRSFMKIKSYRAKGEAIIRESMKVSSLIRNDPVDLINIAIQELLINRYELPAFSTLNRLAFEIRTKTHNKLYSKVLKKLKKTNKDSLKKLLIVKAGESYSPFNRLKELPKSPTFTHLGEWLDRLEWIKSLGSVDCFLEGISANKIELFAEEARVYDASEIKGLEISRQFTLILSMIHSALGETIDNLVEMFLKKMKSIHYYVKEKLIEIREENTELNEKLIDVFSLLLRSFADDLDKDKLQKVIDNNGGIEELIRDCEKVNAYKNNNYLPLLWPYYIKYRSLFFRLLKSISIDTTSEDDSLIKAINYLKESQHKKSQYIKASVDLNFISTRWKKLVIVKDNDETMFDRRFYELCVFSYIADELRSGDLFVEGSIEFNDYRNFLLTWEECLEYLDEYFSNLGLPNNPEELNKVLFDELFTLSKNVDANYPATDQLVIDDKGNVKLKRYKKNPFNPETVELARLIENKMPERKLIDILCNIDHWTGWTRHFSPISGLEAKLEEPKKHYILTILAYGSSLGPTQLAKHMDDITAHMMSYTNRKHVTIEKQNKAIADIANVFKSFTLSKLWGNEDTVAADGTHIRIYEDNLLAEYHIRYGASGGIAYHHVSDNYVALFSNFIPCGVWEAVYILDALLENQSEIKPDKIHADTQGQSTPVFALSYLLGINLMPRIRNWKDLTFYRPDAETKYENIDPLFGDPINWELIKTHWKDMMQVAISIQKGKISSSMLLRKLGNYSKKNRIYKAFQELGRVIRTQFLLKYISDPNLPKTITAASNKVEIYHNFSEHFRFGSHGVLRSNDPVEQEKMIKYNTIISNSVMLQNVIDMTQIINELIESGVKICEKSLVGLSPYLTSSILRFGSFNNDLSKIPPPFVGLINFN